MRRVSPDVAPGLRVLRNPIDDFAERLQDLLHAAARALAAQAVTARDSSAVTAARILADALPHDGTPDERALLLGDENRLVGELLRHAGRLREARHRPAPRGRPTSRTLRLVKGHLA